MTSEYSIYQRRSREGVEESNTGKDVIMEVNGTSSVFSPFGVEEDMAAFALSSCGEDEWYPAITYC